MAYSDCWSDVLRAKYLTSLVLFHDYRKGLVSPGLDRFARTAVLANNNIQSGVPGKAVVSRTGGYVSVADGGIAPELSLPTAGTIIVFLRAGGWPFDGGKRIAYKVTGAAGYDFYIGNTVQLVLIATGGSVEVVGNGLTNSVSLGVSWTSGAVPRFYGNGVFRSVGSVAVSAPAETSTLYIGCATGPSLPIPPPMQSFLIFNEQLTGAEISQLHSDFMESAHYL
jgi:hypothetical protein